MNFDIIDSILGASITCNIVCVFAINWMRLEVKRIEKHANSWCNEYHLQTAKLGNLEIELRQLKGKTT